MICWSNSKALYCRWSCARNPYSDLFFIFWHHIQVSVTWQDSGIGEGSGVHKGTNLAWTNVDVVVPRPNTKPQDGYLVTTFSNVKVTYKTWILLSINQVHSWLSKLFNGHIAAFSYVFLWSFQFITVGQMFVTAEIWGKVASLEVAEEYFNDHC